MLYGAVCYCNTKAATNSVQVSGVVSPAGTAALENRLRPDLLGSCNLAASLLKKTELSRVE